MIPNYAVRGKEQTIERSKVMTKGIVNKVLDGDTLRLQGGKALRLANVCTPETGIRGVYKAKLDLERFVLGTTVLYRSVGKFYGRNVALVKFTGKSIRRCHPRKNKVKLAFICHN